MNDWLTPEFEAGGLTFRFRITHSRGRSVTIYLESPDPESGEWAWCTCGRHYQLNGYRPYIDYDGSGTHWAVRTIDFDEHGTIERWWEKRHRIPSWENQIADAVSGFQAEIVEYFLREELRQRKKESDWQRTTKALENVASRVNWHQQTSSNGGSKP